jgi:type II secretory pathway component GspD/PulD (secretin)
MKPGSMILAALMLAAVAAPATADVAPALASVKPQYLPPAELARILNVHTSGSREVVEWRGPDALHTVEVRRSDAANQVILAGTPEDIAVVEALIKAADLPPRQVAIEARIVEVDESRARDLGIDWSRLNSTALVQQRASWNSQVQKTVTDFGTSEPRTRQRLGQVEQNSQLSLANALQLLDENGAATYRDAPRILTLNNHRATILDGQHVTYVTRYSSATNLFATDSMEAGLRLSVLPSLGESGYLTLDLRAELTSMTGNISGSPVKDGQVVENTVMVKDGDSVLLGGFTRTVSEVTHRRFPLLGHVLPFVFSRDIVKHSQRQSFFIITPHVVDLAGGLDAGTKGAVEGR